MNTVVFRTALGAAAVTAALCVWPVVAAQPVTFLCNAPSGHVCQFSVKTAAGPINFALPSGERKEVTGLTPHADKYCVCDPGPVTADCKAPQLGHWCLGDWVAVDPGLNSENDAGMNAFASAAPVSR